MNRYTEFGDAIRLELLDAHEVLSPQIDRAHQYLTGFENIYQEDPILLRDLLWRCLHAMIAADGHILQAERIRHQASARRTAAIKRERRKKDNVKR